MSSRYTGNFDQALPFSDTCSQFALATGTALSYTVPGQPNQKYIADFGYAENSNVYIGLNTTAAVPSAGTTTSTAYIEYKPVKRFVNAGDVISFITPDTTAQCGVSLRTIPG